MSIEIKVVEDKAHECAELITSHVSMVNGVYSILKTLELSGSDKDIKAFKKYLNCLKTAGDALTDHVKDMKSLKINRETKEFLTGRI